MKVWVVNCGDTGCDEPGYIAFAMVYATRAKAKKVMQRSVRDEEQSLETKAHWSDDGEMAVIDHDGRQIVFTLNEEEVR